VHDALRRADRPLDAAMIVAVSKRQSVAAIQEAYRAGQRHFGESYLQEALLKIESIDLPDIVWHFIGRIQSNKTKAIAERFQWVHALDRAKTAERLDAQRPYYAPPLDVLIQVSLAGEPAKGGVEPGGVEGLAAAVLGLPRLRLRGLMTMPPAQLSREKAARYFDELAALRARLSEAGFALDTLSMGMSADFETALAHGSTCVRIGEAIFGPRER
jgi:pyridoxal phosphate enzyme (YggS family)